MANARRGEVALRLGERTYTLCLTLGALAELEDAFGVPDLAGLAERFAAGRLRGRDLVALLGVALRGGGHPMSDADVAALPLEGGLAPITDALADVVAAAFGAEEGDESQKTLRCHGRARLPVGRRDEVRARRSALVPKSLLARDAPGARRGGDPRRAGPAATRSDLARLMAAFPDRSEEPHG